MGGLAEARVLQPHPMPRPSLALGEGPLLGRLQARQCGSVVHQG